MASDMGLEVAIALNACSENMSTQEHTLKLVARLVEQRTQSLGSGHALTLRARLHGGSVELLSGRLDAAEETLSSIMDGATALAPGDVGLLCDSMYSLSMALVSMGSLQWARTLLRSVLETRSSMSAADGRLEDRLRMTRSALNMLDAAIADPRYESLRLLRRPSDTGCDVLPSFSSGGSLGVATQAATSTS